MKLPEQHYKHMMQLVQLIWLNMQDSISQPEMEEMRDGFAKWLAEDTEEGSEDDSEIEVGIIMDGHGQPEETNDEEEEDAESLGVEDDIDMDAEEDEEEEGDKGNDEADRWNVEEELEEEEEEGAEAEETVRVDGLVEEDSEEEESEMEEPLPCKRRK
ncbi:hypothetical protein HK405_004242 [Cladochytrium tenue]|nr:hypothetical protein HK405_004242 [Cladochytrium tenue]